MLLLWPYGHHLLIFKPKAAAYFCHVSPLLVGAATGRLLGSLPARWLPVAAHRGECAASSTARTFEGKRGANDGSAAGGTVQPKPSKSPADPAEHPRAAANSARSCLTNTYACSRNCQRICPCPAAAPRAWASCQASMLPLTRHFITASNIKCYLFSPEPTQLLFRVLWPGYRSYRFAGVGNILLFCGFYRGSI